MNGSIVLNLPLPSLGLQGIDAAVVFALIQQERHHGNMVDVPPKLDFGNAG